MRRLLFLATVQACALLAGAPAAAQVLPGDRLPEGPERPVRERDFHIQSYKAELAFDMAFVVKTLKAPEEPMANFRAVIPKP